MHLWASLTAPSHEFEWRREECFIIRKPDPAVLIASTKEPPGRLQTRNVQLLYYNINRYAHATLTAPLHVVTAYRVRPASTSMT